MKTEPVVLFSALAGLVGLALHWLLPDALIPDEVIVAVVFVVACIAREFVSPLAKIPDAELLEQARRAVESNRGRGGGAAGVAFVLLLGSPATAPASDALHCEEWPHWARAYDNMFNYDHTGGEAIEWLQLAGCPPVWDGERWLPNGTCNAPCELAEERVRAALEEPALEATIAGGCAPACTTEPAVPGDPRREPLTFTVNIDTRRDVDVVERAASGAAAAAGGAGEGCACTLQVESGSTGQCYAPLGVDPDEWSHVTTRGDARAEWVSPQRREGQFRGLGRGQMRMSYLLGGERVQCEEVAVTQTVWQRFVGVVTDPRVVVGGAVCGLGVLVGGMLCGL